VKQPPRQQAYWRGQADDAEGCGCVTAALFILVGVLIGATIAYLLLHSNGML
jgi:hypothetical protein